MCIDIAVADDLQEIAIWDPDEVTIYAQQGAHPHDVIRAIHAILVDLGAPSGPGGLLCFCGTRIDLQGTSVGPQTP
ncbi:hypothetical protein [Streptomyces uncialis]|uniref:hypothetical protein n=1 Tax=Streptomyces uncialis TaxID=1048205 RepID=UPI002254CA0E|nr:hypothetical protein [Streptomyces uncialis]MCX4661468.1 hypothetical protein [Streptomyces uncialis]